MKFFWSPIVLAVLFSGCAALDSGEGDLRNGDGVDGEEDGYDNDDCKVEDSDIGVLGVTVDLGDKVVTFEDWVPKADSDGEYIGFAISVSDGQSINYVVKTGGELHPDSVELWSHPNGDSGADVPAISNVDFCEECEDGSCDGGGDDGGDDDGGDDGDGDDGDGDTPIVE